MDSITLLQKFNWSILHFFFLSVLLFGFNNLHQLQSILFHLPFLPGNIWLIQFCLFFFQIGKHLETSEYQAKIVPCVIKLFSSPDRATRVKLLQQVRSIPHVNRVESVTYPSTFCFITKLLWPQSGWYMDTFSFADEQILKCSFLCIKKKKRK